MPDARSDPIAPPGVDLTRPSAARIYDFILGGSANWAVDREFGQRLIDRLPLVKDMALANRMFLNRVVRHLTTVGIRQFLDIGAGVPTAGNTHQVADEIAPDSRVVYVDNEPVAVAHAEILLDRVGDPDRHAIINADLREPDKLWQSAFDTGLLDPEQPIALLMIAVLHFYHTGPDGNDIGADAVRRYRGLLRPGSYLALSHLTFEGIPHDVREKVTENIRMYDHSVSSRIMLRDHAEIRALFGEFDLVSPGIVWTPQWRPDGLDLAEPLANFGPPKLRTPSHSATKAGLARKPDA